MMSNTVSEYLRRLKENPLDRSTVLGCVSLLKKRGDINYAWKLVFSYCSQKPHDVEALEALRELEKIRMQNEPSGTKLSFIYIVLNGMPFLEYSLKSVYDFAHEIIIVEGAVDNCMFAANSDGSSKDGTVEFIKSFPDPEKKIKLIQGQWPEKKEMTNEALKYVTGDYLWLSAADEVYRKEDIQKIIEILRTNPGVTQISLIPYNFWKGFDYIFESPRLLEKGFQFQGPFKYLKGAQFINHRPVQLRYPGYVFTSDVINRIDGRETTRADIRLFHYNYVLDEQVKQKIELYHRYGWGKSWDIDLIKWYNECFLKWRPWNREEIESKYPVWTGDKNSHTVPFGGTHPKVMMEYVLKDATSSINLSAMQHVIDAVNEIKNSFPQEQINAIETGTIRSFYERHFSTYHISRTLADRGNLISVDISGDSIRVSKQICHNSTNISFVQSDSIKYLRELKNLKFHFVFLDSVNDKDFIFEEFRLTVPMMVERGILMVDDAGITRDGCRIDTSVPAQKGHRVWEFLKSCGIEPLVLETPNGHGTQLKIVMTKENLAKIRSTLGKFSRETESSSQTLGISTYVENTSINNSDVRDVTCVRTDSDGALTVQPRRILIDGVIFQLQANRPLGISKVWHNLIHELRDNFHNHSITILRRKGFPTHITGLPEYEIPAYRGGPASVLEADDAMLTRICNELNADIFLSTYYTHALGVRNVLIIHDLIPEIFGFDLSKPEWLAKQRAIANADSFIAVSNNTKADLVRIYQISPERVTVAYNGVSDEFHPAQQQEIKSFTQKYDIRFPYFVLVGNRDLYKNCVSFFRAFASLPQRDGLQIFASGNKQELLPEEAVFAQGCNFTSAKWLSDAELSTAYSGALALVYLSRYEGFGLPVLEAMACGCPVITAHNTSLPEVGDDAVLYVNPDSPEEIAKTLQEVMKPDVRARLVASGLQQARKFNWKKMAHKVAEVLLEKKVPEISVSSSSTVVSPHDLNQHGEKLLSNGDTEKALNAFMKAVEMNPDFVAAHNNIGKVYWKKGVVSSASKHFLKALKIDPYDRTTVLNCGQFLTNHGRIKDARKLYWSYLQKNPNDNEITQALENLDSGKAIETCEGLASKHKSSLTTVPENEVWEQNQTQDEKSKYVVSAIVSTYNAERFIRSCLEDLVSQSLFKKGKLEIVVINSGSQQNEEAIVHEYQQKHDNIVYIRTKHREGVYAAWNQAIKVARGTFLTNANTDDRHRQDALEIMANTLLANPEIALVYGDQISTNTPNDTFANYHGTDMTRKPDYSRQRLLFGCCVGSQPMWQKSLHNEFGYFDDTLTCAADWDLWLRISSKYKFKHIPESLGLYYHNEDGIEHSRKIHSLYERYIVGRRYGTQYISVIPLYESKNNPLVSVIMPAYNAAEYIAEAIESVLIQSYRNFELIVVDDGSTDNTKDIVASFKDDKIKYFHKENNGPSSARTLAIKKARGQYIVPLDSDDMMTPHFIAGHLMEFEKHPEADLVYCDDCLIDEDDKPIRVIERREYTDRKYLIRDLFCNGFPIVPFRTCIRRSVFDKIGFYDEDLWVGEDYDMMRRFVKHGLKIHHLKGAFYLRRMTSNSLSRDCSAQKAKCHFDVLKRFTDTFGYDELFPDVVWDKIPPEIRQLHTKCLAAMTYLAIGQYHVKSNSPPVYIKTAFGQACSELNDCLKMDPHNQRVRQLLQKCEFARARYAEAVQQALVNQGKGTPDAIKCV